MTVVLMLHNATCQVTEELTLWIAVGTSLILNSSLYHGKHRSCRSCQREDIAILSSLFNPFDIDIQDR